MGGIVKGLLIQTKATLRGRLARKNIAVKAEAIICEGIGMDIQKSPIKKALETECRLRCQIFGLWSHFPKTPNPFMLLTLSGWGR